MIRLPWLRRRVSRLRLEGWIAGDMTWVFRVFDIDDGNGQCIHIGFEAWGTKYQVLERNGLVPL